MASMIRIEGLTKSYQLGRVEVRALRGVDFAVDAGEFLAIMGPSGSGKSTLMNIIGCLDTPTTGSYSLEGVPVHTLSDDDLARIRNSRIGFIFQTFNLLPRASALENVALPLLYGGVRSPESRAAAALEEVGLGGRAGHRPSEMSGGERQRAAIARAIVTAPAILLADEPTGNLDSVTGREIMELFRGLNEKGVTVIVVTHEKVVAEYARRVVHLRDGGIVN